MSEDTGDNGFKPLTPVERARLRPTVDVAALEQLLGATGGQGRHLFLAYFAKDPTIADMRAALLELGAAEEVAVLDEELAIQDRLFRDPSTTSDASPRRAFLPPQPSDFVIEPEDDRFRALWRAVEPDGPNDPDRDRTG